jgi:hypothetical protein
MVWLIIGLLLASIALITTHLPQFQTNCKEQFDQRELEFVVKCDQATGSLKSLVCFLVMFKIVYYFSSEVNGYSILNTFEQGERHDVTGQEFTAIDIIGNFLLYGTIVISVFY